MPMPYWGSWLPEEMPMPDELFSGIPTFQHLHMIFQASYIKSNTSSIRLWPCRVYQFPLPVVWTCSGYPFHIRCPAWLRKNGATQLDPQHCWMFPPACTKSWLRAVNPTTFRHTTQILHECGRMKPFLWLKQWSTGILLSKPEKV
jgi:hypothetical protein